MVSARVVGQVGALAFSVGAGFFISSMCDSAVASASTGDSGTGHSASASTHHSSSSTHTASNHTVTPAAASVSSISAVPASAAVASATPAPPHLPTPVQVIQTVQRDLVGLERNVENGLTNIGRALGVVKPAGATIYGNPNNSQYWSEQSSQNCVLMATASVIGQLKGAKVTEAAIVAQATTTPSVDDPSRMMYLGLDTDDRVSITNAEQLLKLNGIDAETVTFKSTQGLTALRALEKDLKAGDGVMVGVNAGTIWNAENADPTAGAVAESADHEVAVIAYNATTQTVYINDSGIPNGAGYAVPLAVFMRAWQADSFETTAAVLAQAATAAIAA